MGRLMLPASGKVYVDSNIIIYTVEHVEPYHAPLEHLWAAAAVGQVHLKTSQLTALETLVRPLRQQNHGLVAAFAEALEADDLEMIPNPLDILREAARLRAEVPSLRTPDAIHAATALLTGCDLLVSHDLGFRAVPGLKH